MKKLIAIQGALKAPKGQENKFGGYKYRSCEDILEAVKPLLKEENAALTLSDFVEIIGSRVYVKAVARLLDETGHVIAEAQAFARETEAKKGMDEAQVTGAASSYARKYALNGLFAIDDTKDADTFDNRSPANDDKNLTSLEDFKHAIFACQNVSELEALYYRWKDSPFKATLAACSKMRKQELNGIIS